MHEMEDLAANLTSPMNLLCNLGMKTDFMAKVKHKVKSCFVLTMVKNLPHGLSF